MSKNVFISNDWLIYMPYQEPVNHVWKSLEMDQRRSCMNLIMVWYPSPWKPVFTALSIAHWFFSHSKILFKQRFFCLFRSCRKAPMVACDFCPLVYHLDCLDPPLVCMPVGKWMCPTHPQNIVWSFFSFTTFKLVFKLYLVCNYWLTPFLIWLFVF